MLPIEIKPGITWVGVNDRITPLFEGLWDIQKEGVAYNSYLICDKKNVVIDISKAIFSGEYMDQLQSVIDPAKLDYVVINHMEPDHTGALRTLLKMAPNVQLLGTAKTQDMLRKFYGITENVRVVTDGETLYLGRHTLRFISTPFLHWPETMMTYEESEQILFSCDAFGSYGVLNGNIFDDPSMPIAWFEEQALRYYTNIIAIFPKPVGKAIEKLADLPIKIIAPSHGLVRRNNPQRIIELYKKWCSLATEPADLGVTLLFASMYGNTEEMMEVVAQGIMDTGVPLTVYNVSKTPISYILPSLFTQRGVMVGAPTYEGGLFPDMKIALEIASGKHIFGRKTACFGSHAWVGGGEREFSRIADTLNWEMLGTFVFTGSPSHEELIRGRAFGAEFANKLKI
jgi:anaerobic nitric oxide reductase flavorubredoxin